MQLNNRSKLIGPALFPIVFVALVMLIVTNAMPAARAEGRVPLPRAASPSASNVYTVTSSSNAAITTCAGAANDCSLRGAVQLANASIGADTINVSTTVTAISLSSPITLTDNNITIQGNGQGIAGTSLKTIGNFPALVVNSNDNLIDGFWINANSSHAGINQHGLVLNGNSNYISHNSLSDLGGYGVLIQNSSDNILDSNTIGVRALLGTPGAACTYANDLSGIRIGNATGTAIAYNTIGCNKEDGINIAGASATGNDLFSNYIGIVNGGGRVTNTLTGVAIWGGAHNNLIGDTAYGNVIGANGTYGVYIGGAGTDTNIVQLNSIGISGTTNMSNTLDGVTIQAGAASNQVLTNTIAYNGNNGVYLTGTGTNFNLLRANTLRLNNSRGVMIDGGAFNNFIGLGGARSTGNVISANTLDGVYIAGANTTNNLVYGNDIGTNATGNASDPNGQNGVMLDLGTHHNAIGYLSNERNVIAGNRWAGVSIVNGAHDNSVQFNDIGTNRDYQVPAAQVSGPAQPAGGSTSYLHLPNGTDGVSIIGAYTNTIGGYVAGVQASNFVYYNTASGVYLANGSHHNVIGASELRGNNGYGLILDGNNTAYNTITRTLIYQNNLDGIGERNNAALNVWTEVGINDNGGLGIDKNIPNSPGSGDSGNVVNAPNIVFDSINRATGVVQGHAAPSILGTVKIELYRVSPDPSGFGEGGVFLGSTTTDVSGSWTINDPSPLAARGCYTAFATESQIIIPYSSSEFNVNTCRTFLPLVLK